MEHLTNTQPAASFTFTHLKCAKGVFRRVFWLHILMCVLLLAVGETNGQSFLPKAQNDSLWAVWNDVSKHDTMRILAMKDISWDGYLHSQPDSAFYYAQMQYDLAKKAGRTGGMADALNTQGSAYYVMGNLDKAIDLYTQSMIMREKQGNKQAVAATLSNLGNILFMRGNLSKAMDNYSKCYEVMQQLGDTRGMAVSLSNMADTYKEQGAFEQALSFYARGMKISEDTEDKQGAAYALDNIGTIHRAKGDLGQAVANYMKSLRLNESRGDSADMAASYNHLGDAYDDMDEDSMALAYHGHSLRISSRFTLGLLHHLPFGITLVEHVWSFDEQRGEPSTVQVLMVLSRWVIGIAELYTFNGSAFKNLECLGVLDLPPRIVHPHIHQIVRCAVNIHTRHFYGGGRVLHSHFHRLRHPCEWDGYNGQHKQQRSHGRWFVS